jgi:hypothetical protein
MFPPELSTVRGSERATGFASRYRQLGIEGVMLHSYRGMYGTGQDRWLWEIRTFGSMRGEAKHRNRQLRSV